MMAETENPVCDHLPHMRGQCDRMGSKTNCRGGRLAADLAHIHVTPAAQPLRLYYLDLYYLDQGVIRIEKRHDLAEG